MNIEQYVASNLSTYHTEGDKVSVVAKTRSGIEFRGEGIYTGAGNWVKVNDFEKIFIPIFHTDDIPSGHYYEMRTTPLVLRVGHNPT